jgi:lipopolysaccharide export LptBFGC system permease protein LptF
VRIVSRYLLREFLLASGAVLAALLLVWTAADTLLHIDELGSQGLSSLGGVVLRSAEIVPLGVPMACAIGIIWSLTRAARFREITAIRCGGIPLRLALWPTLAICLAIGLGLAFFEDRVLVPAHRTLQGVDDGEEKGAAPQWVGDRWWFARGSWLLSAAAFDTDTVALQDVTAFLLGPDRQIVERIDARTARSLEGGSWQLEDAQVRRFQGEQVTLESAPERVIDLGLRRQELASLSEPDLMTLRALWRGTGRDSAATSSTRARELSVKLHERLARPIAVLLLVLFVIPFALGDVERGDSFPRALVQGLGAAGLFWAIWTLALVTGQSGHVRPGLAIWGVTAAALALGAYRYRAIDR